MGFMQWVSGVLGFAPVSATRLKPASPSARATSEDEIEGLNFRKAVEIHQIWKTRLQQYITSNNKQPLDVTQVANADACILGQWMKRIGNARYGNETLYKNLHQAHIQFHLNAGQVVQIAQLGDQRRALEMLNQGEYPLSALRLVSLLARLYQRCQDGTI